MKPLTLNIDRQKSEATIVLERSRPVFPAAGDRDPYALLLQRVKQVVIDGAVYYVVEGDTLLDKDQLYFYAHERDRQSKSQQYGNMLELAGMATAILTQPDSGGVISSQSRGLVGIMHNGRVVRWSEGKVLTYCVIRETFGGDDGLRHYQQVVHHMQAATTQWEQTCNITFRHVKELDDAPLSDTLNDVVFPVRELDVGGALIAAAFFPNDPLVRRRLIIDPSYFSSSMTFDPVGVLRHELGHVLGFRHEHIRSQAPPICQGEDSEGTVNITDYDPKSVMHYFCGDVGSRDLAITETDRIGAQVVYGPPRHYGLQSASVSVSEETVFRTADNLAFVP